MHTQSKAWKRLVRVYRQLLGRLRALERASERTIRQRVFMRVHVEMLQPRVLMSVSPSGAETLVNTTTAYAMQNPAVAMNPAGNSVIVWNAVTSSGGEVLGQRYNINGDPVGGQFQVNQSPAGTQRAPSVAIDDVGDFVVAWDGLNSSAYVRVFNSSGTAITGDTLVTASLVGTSRTVVAMNASGAFVVAWEGSGAADSDGIFAEHFLENGLASGSPFLVNTTTAGSHTNPSIAMDSAGDFVVAWTDNSTALSTIQAAYFPSTGSTISQFAAGAESGGAEDNSSVGIDSSGSFVIAWQTNFSGSSSWDINACGFSASASPASATPVIVNNVSNTSQADPAVAMRADGSYLIAWESDGQDGSGQGVYAQAFTAAGALDGSVFPVNTTTSGNQQDPAAAWTGGTAVIAWDGNGAGDSAGVFLQRYTASGTANQMPIIAGPVSKAIYKNNTVTFSSAGSDAISVSDADADGGVEQIDLTASNGTLALAAASGLTFSSGGNNSAAMTFTGTLANLNAALNGMVFTPTSNFAGAAGVQIVTNDLGNTGTGGPASATKSVTIDVDAPPTSNTFPATQTAVENTALVFSPPTDNGLYIGSGWDYLELEATHGKLTLATTSGLSFSSGNGSGDATMEFGGSVSAMNAALDGLIFTPTTGYTGTASVKIVTSNGGLLGLGLLASSSTSTIAITVTAPAPAVNHPPAVTVPGTQTTAEGSALVLGVSNAISLSDSEASGNSEQVTLIATSGTLTLAGTSGLTFSTGTGAVDSNMTFTGTLASINTALSGLTFTPASLFYGSGGIYLAIDDTGTALTATATVAINVTEVNQAPAVAVPAAQAVAENGTLAFSSAGGNAVVVSDVDAYGAAEQVTLTAANGTLSLGSSTNLTIDAGGNGQSSITVTGTLADINAALDTLNFSPTSGFVGSASLQISDDDLGNTGSGGPLTTANSVSVNVFQSLVVTTALDVVNGDTSSVANLVADPGPDGISLREAILAVNNTPGPQIAIDFDIPGSGAQVITLGSALPQIDNPVLLDATTQPGYTTVPLIELDGQGTPAGTNGLAIGASNTTVRGLAIYGFAGNGIDVAPAGVNDVTILGNYIGINAAGAAIGNGVGIALQDSSDDLVGGTTALARNIISGNLSEGVYLGGASSTNDTVAGNLIGTNPAGTAAIGNQGDGVLVAAGASGDTIGGTSAGAGNVISGNSAAGVEITGTSSDANSVEGNYVGTNASGTAALANGDNGVLIDSGAADNVIGSTVAGAGNIISGNTGDGIDIDSTASTGNVIEGNYIGIDHTGSVTLANTGDGVDVQTDDNTIGGSAAGSGNVISGNGLAGIDIESTGNDNSIERNYVGLNVAGTAAIANAIGIQILGDSNTVGGLTATAGNVISGNIGDGVEISGFSGTSNLLQGNYIGTNAAGFLAVPNGGFGVDVTSGPSNTIGGTTPGTGNVISGNTQGGIRVTGGSFLVSEDDNIARIDAQTGAVLETYPTALANGSVAIGSDGSFYVPDYSNNVIDHYNADGTLLSTFGSGYLSSPQDMIFGPDGNIYVGNVGAGVQEFGPGGAYIGTFVANGSGGLDNTKGMVFGPDGNLYVANYTDSDVLEFNGTTGAFIGTFVASGNGGLSEPEDVAFGPDGNLYVSDYSNNTIDRYNGSTGASMGVFATTNLSTPYGIQFDSDGNLDVACRSLGTIQTYNGQTGAFMNDLVTGLTNPAWFTTTPGSTGSDLIQGNFIGTTAGGSAPLPNGVGLAIDASNVTVGGTAAGAGNLIADNSGNGITISGGSGNAVEVNSIFGNGALGSELGSGAAANTGTEDASLPNDGMNFPVLTSATLDGTTLTVAGYVGSAADQSAFANARVEIFQADTAGNYVQGETFLGALTTDANGNFSGSTSTGALSAGDGLTATATDASGNTSQFGASIVLNVVQPPSVTVPAAQTAIENCPLVFSTATGNPITVSDSYSSGAPEQVTLSTTTGTLSLASTTGISFDSGSNAAAAMTISGTLADLNTALDGLILAPAAGYAASATLSVGINDLNSGLSAAGSVAINLVSTLTVTTATDVLDGNTSSINALLANPGTDGKISLREAITAVNNTLGNYTIDFDIPGAGTQTITLASALPTLTNSMLIDGTSQPGYSGTPLIAIVGSTTSAGTNGFTVDASNCAIMGLAVDNFTGDGIDVSGANGATIQADYIGLNPAGASAPNGTGIVLSNSTGDVVGGASTSQRNTVSGNTGDGIDLTGTGTTGDVVGGNFIGTNPAGTAALANGGVGVSILDGASGNVIGASGTQADLAGYFNRPGIVADGSTFTEGFDGGGSAFSSTLLGNSLVWNGNTYNFGPLGGDNAVYGTGQTIPLPSGFDSTLTFLGAGVYGDQLNQTFTVTYTDNSTQTFTQSLGDWYIATSYSGQSIAASTSYRDTDIGGMNAGPWDLFGYSFALDSAKSIASITLPNNHDIVLLAIDTSLAASTTGNVISGNTGYGVEISGTSSTDNLVQGNLIGTSASGSTSVTNGDDGIFLNDTTGNTIGGTSPVDRNVISANANVANTSDGIWIDGGSSNIVQGNFIGTDASGTVALGNANDGITISSSTGNLVGGATVGAGNVISGNSNYGLEIDGPSSSGNLIQGNFIGTNAAGTASISNGNDGIWLNDVTGVTIGDTLAGDGNLISGNTNAAESADGVWIDGGSGNTVQGNLIGTDITGAANLGNYHDGVEIESSSDNLIGGTSAGAGNTIAYNSEGVTVWGSGAVGNSILENSIFGNTTLGIDLGNDGITANTGSLNSSLANNGMNFPVFTSVALAGDILSVTGYIGTAPNQSAFAGAQIDLYQSDNSHANGEGKTWLASLVADSSGNFSESLTVTGLSVGDIITATATDGAGDTSEFSANATVAVPVAHTPSISSATTDENQQSVSGLVITPSSLDSLQTIYFQITNVTGGTLFLSDGVTAVADDDFITAAQGEAGLKFTPTPNSTMPGGFDVQASLTSDDSGLGGSVVAAIITVIGPPTITIDSSPLAYTQGQGAVAIDPQLLVSDPFSATLASATVTLSGYVAGEDLLGFTFQNGIGGTWNSTTGVLTLTGTASPALYQEALESVTYTDESLDPSTAPRSAQFTASDGTLVSAPAIQPISVTAVNLPPAVAAPTTLSTVEDTPITFAQPASAIVITDIDANGGVEQASLSVSAGTLTLSDTAGLTFVNGTTNASGLLTFTGTLASIDSALRTLTFTEPLHFTGSAMLNVTADDLGNTGVGGPMTGDASITINVTAPVIPPTPQIVVDTGLTTEADVVATITPAALAAAESGASSDQLTFTLTQAPTFGTLLLAGQALHTGGTFTESDIEQGRLTYESSAAQTADDAFTFTVTDAAGVSTPAAVFQIHTVGIVAPPPPITVTPNPVLTLPAPPVEVPPVDFTGPSTAGPIYDTGLQGGSQGGIQGGANTVVAPSTPILPESTTGRVTLISAVSAVPVGPVLAPVFPHAPPGNAVEVAAPVVASAVRSDGVVPGNIDVPIPSRASGHVPVNAAPGAVVKGPYAGLGSTNGTGSKDGANPQATFDNSSPAWRQLDAMESQITSERKIHIVAGTASLVSLGMSVAYFMWAVRAGSVLSSLLSSMPAWKLVDPLPILDQFAGTRRRRSPDGNSDDGAGDDETLESMVDGPRKAA